VQRSIEILIGRLITDADFRRFFLRDPRGTLTLAGNWGLALSAIEIHALLSTDHSLWERVARELDARLHKVNFTGR
jgi:hypothetical protein